MVAKNIKNIYQLYSIKSTSVFYVLINFVILADNQIVNLKDETPDYKYNFNPDFLF